MVDPMLLYRNGYMPLPLNPEGKGLKINEWPKLAAARDIDGLWSHAREDANVGSFCGEFVIEADFDNHGDHPNGRDVFDWLSRDISGVFAGAIIVRTPTDGRHAAFRFTPGAVSFDGNGVGKTYARFELDGKVVDVELLTRNSQAVIPPSKTEKGVYEYLSLETHLNTRREDLPPLHAVFCDANRRYVFERLQQRQATPVPTPAPKRDDELDDEDRRVMLEALTESHTVGEGKRHNSALGLAKKLAGFDYSESDIQRAVERIFSTGKPAEYREVDGIVRDAMASPDATSTPPWTAINEARRKRKPVPSKAEPPVEEKPDAAITMEAERILSTGKPLEYAVKAYAKNHVGDPDVCLVMQICKGAQWVENNGGLQTLIRGKSQIGKTHSADGALQQHPTITVITGTLSPQALYYLAQDGKLMSGMTVMMDDKKGFDDTFEETLKSYISRWDVGLDRFTVEMSGKKKGSLELSIPARVNFVVTSADADFNEETYNRFFAVEVDDSEEQDSAVATLQRHKAIRAEKRRGKAREILVVREMICLLSEKMVTVEIPWAQLLDWRAAQKRNLQDMFFDTVKAVAAWHQRQRPHSKDGHVIATLDDLEIAGYIWEKYGVRQVHHTIDEDAEILRVFKEKAITVHDGDHTYYRLNRKVWIAELNKLGITMSDENFSHKMNGRKAPDGVKRGGLTSRVSGLIPVDISTYDSITSKTIRGVQYECCDMAAIDKILNKSAIFVLNSQSAAESMIRFRDEKDGVLFHDDQVVSANLKKLYDLSTMPEADIAEILTLEKSVNSVVKSRTHDSKANFTIIIKKSMKKEK